MRWQLLVVLGAGCGGPPECPLCVLEPGDPPCAPTGLHDELDLGSSGRVVRLDPDGRLLTATFSQQGQPWEFGESGRRAIRVSDGLEIVADRRVGYDVPELPIAFGVSGDLVAWVYGTDGWEAGKSEPAAFHVATWDGELVRAAPLDGIDSSPNWIVPADFGWWLRLCPPLSHCDESERLEVTPYLAAVDEDGDLLVGPDRPCGLTEGRFVEGPFGRVGVISARGDGRVCDVRIEGCQCWEGPFDRADDSSRIHPEGRDLAWAPEALVYAVGADDLWLLPWDRSEPVHVSRSETVGEVLRVRLHRDGQGILRSYVPYSDEHCACMDDDYEGYAACLPTPELCGRLLVERVALDGGAVGEAVRLGHVNVPMRSASTLASDHRWATLDGRPYLLWRRIPAEPSYYDEQDFVENMGSLAIARVDCPAR